MDNINSGNRSSRGPTPQAPERASGAIDQAAILSVAVAAPASAAAAVLAEPENCSATDSDPAIRSKAEISLVEKAKVLLVDDDTSVLSGLRRMLGPGYDVSSASSGAEALEVMLSQGPFSVVISEMKLSDMDGVEYLANAKRIAPGTVRMLLSGKSTFEDAVALVNRGGVFRILSKPCRNEQLKEAVDEAVSKHLTEGRCSEPRAEGRETGAQLEAALRQTLDPVLVLDKFGQTLFHNPSAASFFSAEPEGLERHLVGVPLETDKGVELIHSTNGGVAQMRVTQIQWRGVPSWLVVLRDITEQIEATRALEQEKEKLALANQRLYETSITDPLTGLLNRRGFEAKLWAEASRIQRYGGAMSALLVDCDRFKEINTRFGHAVGDAALASIGQCLKSVTRQTDVVSRYGGDEFLLLLPETWQAQALTVAEKIRTSISALQIPGDDGVFGVSVSIGVAPVSASVSSTFDVVKELRDSLELCKETGRDRVISTELALRAVPRLDDATRSDFFKVLVDPIVALASGEVIGHHCRCEPRSETAHGFDVLSRLAERHGRLVDLDIARLTAIRDRVARLSSSAFHFNVLPSTWMDERAYGLLTSVAEDSGAALCLEISEHEFVAHAAVIRQTLVDLRRRGMRLALRDIELGGHTLEALIYLEPEFIRVSKAFMGHFEARDMLQQGWSRLSQVATAINAQVIAEGVEAVGEAELLDRLGVHLAQGPWFRNAASVAATALSVSVDSESVVSD